MNRTLFNILFWISNISLFALNKGMMWIFPLKCDGKNLAENTYRQAQQNIELISTWSSIFFCICLEVWRVKRLRTWDPSWSHPISTEIQNQFAMGIRWWKMLFLPWPYFVPLESTGRKSECSYKQGVNFNTTWSHWIKLSCWWFWSISNQSSHISCIPMMRDFSFSWIYWT